MMLGTIYLEGKKATQNNEETTRQNVIDSLRRSAPDYTFSSPSNNNYTQDVERDYAEAARWYKLAARDGNVNAQLNLASMYSDGLGVSQDYPEALRWYKLAAARGDAKAQYNIGLIYDNGRGVVQDYVEAVRWYKMAAAQGDADAQKNLAYMYRSGLGMAQNYVKAHMWFNLAAIKGDRFVIEERGRVAAKMTTHQVTEAQRLAKECQARNFKNCD
jgi:hypothetical protein